MQKWSLVLRNLYYTVNEEDSQVLANYFKVTRAHPGKVGLDIGSQQIVPYLLSLKRAKHRTLNVQGHLRNQLDRAV